MERKYDERLEEFYQVNAAQARVYSGYNGFTTFLPSAVTAMVLAYGGHLVMNGAMRKEDLVAFLLYQNNLTTAITGAADVVNGISSALGAAERVFKLIHRSPRWKHGEFKLALTPSEGLLADEAQPDMTIKLENIRFRYPARPEVIILKKLSLEIAPGETVALVGASGGGKSSVINLLENFYESEDGCIKVGDHHLSDYDHEWLHRVVALVGQEPVLFARSIKENILFNLAGTASEPSHEDVIEAAKQASAHNFIMSLPNQYDTEVGEKGVLLSGGQKQRIAIARALVRKPRILLLDEATSALDAESEGVVQEALDSVMEHGQRTVVVVAHRLSTVKNADRIVVLKAGEMVEIGSHQELLKLDGVYAGLVARQLSEKT